MQLHCQSFFKIKPVFHISQRTENLLLPKVKYTVCCNFKSMWFQNYLEQIFTYSKEQLGFIVSLGSCTF